MKRYNIQNITILLIVLLCSCSTAFAATPVTPDASPQARALLNFIHATYGKKTLSGQMWAPWGVDEIETVHKITGKLPAIRGQDYIHERSNKHENQLAIEWWQAGGIPTIMWHWGAPSKGEGYKQSKMQIDIDRCFEPGTAEHTAMWKDLERIADHLTELRDANVPVLWRPMHECDGDWFWYGKGGGQRFVKLWRTMFDYFVHNRKLNNLIWVLCHSHRFKAEWNPGKDYYDLAGADSYGKGIQASLFNKVKSTHGDTIPIPYHECGTIPDPDESFQKNITWSWWMLWHSRHLTDHDQKALIKAYNHDLVLTRDELPDIMDYLKPAPSALQPHAAITHSYLCSDVGAKRVFKVSAAGEILWEYPADQCTDAWLLDNGNVLMSFTGDKRGAREVTPDKKVVWQYTTDSEVWGCQRLDNGNTLVAECTANRLIEVDTNGHIAKIIPVKPTDNAHMGIRHGRKLPNGNYLACFLDDKVVREYDSSAKLIRQMKVPDLAFSAIRLTNGNTVIGYRGGVIELDPKDKVIWHLTQQDVPDVKLYWICCIQRLPNGNTIVGNWFIHKRRTDSTPFFEVTKDKKVVWKVDMHKRMFDPVSIQILDTKAHPLR